MERQAQDLEFYAQGKAFVLLYEFHALRFPHMPVHHHKYRPVDREYIPEGERHVPEEILAGKGLTAVAKAQEIRRQFRDMVRTGAVSTAKSDVYATLLDLCETARRSFRAEEDLSDETGQPLSSREILPSSEVIEAMTEDFVWHRRSRCPPLERFIIQVQTVSE